MNLKTLLDFDFSVKNVALIALVCVIVCYIDAVTIIGWQMKSVQNSVAGVKKLKSDIAQLQKDIVDLENKKQLFLLQQKQISNTRRIIAQSELPGLLNTISQIAYAHGIKIMKIRPSREAERRTKKGSSAEDIPAFIVTLEMLGDYHGVAGFINVLEKGDEFMNVSELRMSTDQRDFFQQNITLQLKVYVKG